MNKIKIERKREQLKNLKAYKKELTEKFGARGQKHAYGSVMGGLNPASLELDKLKIKIKKLEEELKQEKPGNVIISTEKKSPYMYEVRTKNFVAYIGKSDKIFYIIFNGKIQNGDYKTLAEAKKKLLTF